MRRTFDDERAAVKMRRPGAVDHAATAACGYQLLDGVERLGEALLARLLAHGEALGIHELHIG